MSSFPKFRKINRALHRDLGYFFTGVTILFGVSGLAVNHVDHWNPDFIVGHHEVEMKLPHTRTQISISHIKAAVAQLDTKGRLRSYDFPSDQRIKIYFDDGAIVADLETGHGSYETVRRRPVLNQINFLHLHPAGWWRIFSDVFAISLILMAISGLFVLTGRNSFSSRGKWLAGCGLLAPLGAILMT